MQRPEGIDGRDYKFRMVIEDRYRKLAFLRKWIRKLVFVEALYTLFRIARSYMQLAGSSGTLSIRVQEWVASGFGLLALLFYALGGGKPQKENLLLLKLFTLVAFLQAAVGVLESFLYYSHQIHGHSPAATGKFVAQVLGVPNELTSQALDILEPVLDVVGLVSIFAAVYMGRYYVMDKQEGSKPNKEVAAAEYSAPEPPSRRDRRKNR